MAEFKKEHDKILNGLKPDQVKFAFETGNVMNVLLNKDQYGRRVLVLSQGKTWNPDEVSTDNIFQVLYLS